MITYALLLLVVNVVLGTVANLPPYTLDTTAINANAEQVGAWASALNGYAPIGQLGLVLGLLVGLKLALLAWQAVLFIYHQFWGSS